MKILFVRHGKSTANANGTIGTPDTPLAEEGVKQSRAMAQKLKNQHIAVIVCSPFIRAQQTAEIIAGELGIPVKDIRVINELEERRMGDLEGQAKQYESEYFYTNDTEHGFEPRQALITRMQKALEKIIAIAKDTKGPIVAIGHATSGYYLEQVAKGKKHFEDFGPVDQINNAEFVEINTA